jgi:DNA-binding NarL/FixJ family response regulator
MNEMEKQPMRVLVCDDQAVVRDGLAAILGFEPAIAVVGQAANGAEALALIPALRPNVVLMDLNMPVMNGVQATRDITQRFPEVAVLVLTTHASDDWLFDALRAGALGYLLKDTRRDDLIRAVLGAAQGRAFLDPTIAGRVVSQAVATPSANPAAGDRLVEPLSAREVAILQLVAQGLSNPEIGERLHLAHGTVRNYVSEIMAKLGATDRTQAAVVASRLGLI